jgi:glycosyltransferase involved in cell wall biosynthesis
MISEQKETPTNNDIPLVSVVITTKNEESHIGNCLESVVEQSYDNIEIIVVDNNSTDRTKEISREYTDLVFEKGPERSAQRNYGMIDIASGKYVMFIDADMILSQYLIDQCVNYMEKNKALALHISEVILGKRYFSRVRRFERSFYDGTVVDGARFFRKDIFATVGGFDESMSGPEDWDIDKKIKQIGLIKLLPREVDSSTVFEIEWKLKEFIETKGVAVSESENVIYHNESEFDLNKYLSKKRYYTQSFNKYIDKWGKNDPDIKKQFGLSYRFFHVFLKRWKVCLYSAHLLFGMYFLRFFVGIHFLFRNTK